MQKRRQSESSWSGSYIAGQHLTGDLYISMTAWSCHGVPWGGHTKLAALGNIRSYTFLFPGTHSKYCHTVPARIYLEAHSDPRGMLLEQIHWKTHAGGFRWETWKGVEFTFSVRLTAQVASYSRLETEQVCAIVCLDWASQNCTHGQWKVWDLPCLEL
jgi:hypothetical protein